MLETHPNPDEALSDKEQQVTPEGLFSLLQGLTIREEQLSEDQVSGLAALRMQMDSVDEQLIDLLASRMALAEQIGEVKGKQGITVLQLQRWREVFATRSEWAKERGLGLDFVQKVLEQVHKESIRVQTDALSRKKN
jgi:chorismate mutase